MGTLFIEPDRLALLLGTRATASAPGYGVTKAVDGDPATFWHSPWNGGQKLPQAITLDLGRPTTLKGVAYVPRQDMSHVRVKDYQVLVSADGRSWGEAVQKGSLDGSKDKVSILFARPRTGRYLRFLMLSARDGGEKRGCSRTLTASGRLKARPAGSSARRPRQDRPASS